LTGSKLKWFRLIGQVNEVHPSISIADDCFHDGSCAALLDKKYDVSACRNVGLCGVVFPEFEAWMTLDDLNKRLLSHGVEMYYPIARRKTLVVLTGLAIAILAMAGVYFSSMTEDSSVTTTPTDPEDRLEKLLGQKVAFEGIPWNYGGLAEIEVPELGTSLFVPDIEWPQNVLGKTVLISGTLHKRWYIPKSEKDEYGVPSAGANAPWYGIEQAKWKAKETKD
jgi:hypothetical protein